MKYKLYFFAFIFTLVPNEIYSQECTLEGISNPNFPVPIELTDVAYNTFTKTYKFTTGAPTKANPSEPASDIINATIVNGLDEDGTELINLQLSSISSISDLDEFLDRADKTYDEFLRVILDGCSTQFQFEFKIEDTNNHKPSFSNSKLSFNVPNPLVPGVPLSIFGPQIIASDLDYTNNNIQFSIESSSLNFDISTQEESSTSKNFEAVIKPKEYIWLQETTTILLRATDAEGSPSDETLEIELLIDESNVLPDIPAFTMPFYSFTYNGDETNPQITGETITATTNTKADLTLSIKEDSDGIFTLSYDTGSSEISITSNKPIPNPSNNDILTFTLTVTKSKKESASTAILVTMPKDSTPSAVPIFTEAYYTATYKVGETPEAPDTVELEKDISVVGYSEDVVVEVQDENRFKSEKSDDTNSWTIKVVTKLEQGDLDKGDEIVLKLRSSIPGSSGESLSSVRIQLPPVTVLEFTSDTYYAVYKVNEDGATVEYASGNKIAVKNDVKGTTVEFVEANTQFTISPSYDIAVDIPLDQDALIAGNDIILPIKVSLRDLKPAVATLVIQIEANTKITPPQFTEVLYNAKYQVNSGDNNDEVVEINPEILTTSENVQGLSVAVVGTYKEKFSAEKETGSYKINVNADLTEEELNQSEIMIDLEASITGVDETGKAKIILKLPEQGPNIIPQFSEIGYKATYQHSEDSNIPDTLTIDDDLKPIKITSDQADQTVVTVGAEYSSYFTPVSTPEECKFTVIQKLDDTLLATTKQIILNLEATLKGSLNKGRAIVVVDLPLDLTQIRPTPLFTQPFYKSHIDEDNNLVMDDANIAIFGEYEDVTSVSVETKYQLNFILTQNTASKDWTITLDQPLEDETENQIAVQLNAHLNEAPQDGAATLLVRLRADDNSGSNVGKFDDSFYICSYNVVESGDDTVSCDTDVKASGLHSTTTVRISTDDDSAQYFTLRETVKVDSEGTYSFEAIKDLSSEILQSQTELLVVIEVVEGTDKSTATVVVNLPLKENLLPLKFQSNAYTASYSQAGSVQLIDGPITLTNVDHSQNPQVAIKSDDEYYQNFKIVSTEGNNLLWNFAANTPLGQEVLDTKVSITVTVEATIPNRAGSASSAVVVNFPKKTSEYSFSFNENFYTADYENKVVTFNQQILLDGETDGVDISLQGDFAGYFDEERDGNEIKITLDEDLPKEALERPSITISIRAAKGETEILVVPFIINNKAAINGGNNGGSSGKGPNDTTFIIVIAMLAVLLVVGIVGSAIFYYRRRNKMAVVEEPDTTPRFTKNINDSKKASEPSIQRRPTGLYNLNQSSIENDDLSLNNEKEFDAVDRRKSVIFDEVVEEMEIDPNEEDQKDEEEDQRDEEEEDTISNSSTSSNGEEKNERNDDDDDENSTIL